MSNSKLELLVLNQQVGHLNTNIEVLERMVEARLQDYTPEKYKGDVDGAKKDKAELNKARDKIKRARIDLMSELMQPYQDFENRCKTLERKIDEASSALNEIVKVREEEERQAKKDKITELWGSKNFNLFPLEKIYADRWGNKTCKLSDIEVEIDNIIKRTYSDLKIIEKYVEEADIIKAHYLMTLNLEDTIQYADELQRQKEIAAKEKAERENREKTEKIEEQKKEVITEEKQQAWEKGFSALVDEALEIESKPEVNEYVITIQATPEQLTKLKGACNDLGIVYEVSQLEF